MDLLERLLAHDRWATNTLFDACEPLTDEQFGRSFDIGHENIHTTFAHIIGNVLYWTDSMKGIDIDRDQDWSRGNLRSLFEQVYGDFEQFALAVRDAGRLDETFTDSWDQPQSYGAAILHVILHDDEHRQEILHILNRLEIENVPEIDHALWDFVRRGLFTG
ncbi:MAG: DinB family protein [Thermomicrobiales bacterium]|nr:DinB family protein [Thermomicrobiales bacterium]MCO5220246.1 DinB family protein [Thermomicrobiales bacterium]